MKESGKGGFFEKYINYTLIMVIHSVEAFHVIQELSFRVAYICFFLVLQPTTETKNWIRDEKS